MSAQASITVFDGAATPVSHTLTPLGTLFDATLGDVAKWRENLSSVPILANVKITTFRKVLKSGVERTEMRIEVPVMESIAGQNSFGYTAAPRVAYVNQFSLVAYNSPRATIAERRLARQIAINVGNNVSTTVAAATTGPSSEVFDSAITAS